ncbi:MAG: hypothetical protein HZB43_01435 [candidate division Zixibacteria bacterium]|nr:hypothetical protein [candidate division Zixibacteria bacterium]
MALTVAYCAETCDVELGGRYADALRWLPAMRPYELRAELSKSDFFDTAYAVTHIVYTLNDFGRFLLSPSWLPNEFEFLHDNLESAMVLHDPDLTGELLDTYRAFGVSDDDSKVMRAYDFLIESQNPDGSWGEWDWETVYSAFHATWAAMDGLREFSWKGPRLANPRLMKMLQEMVHDRDGERILK